METEPKDVIVLGSIRRGKKNFQIFKMKQNYSRRIKFNFRRS